MLPEATWTPTDAHICLSSLTEPLPDLDHFLYLLGHFRVVLRVDMSGERMSWIASLVLIMGYLGRRVVLALPHEVVALPGTTDALSLRLYVSSSEL